MDPETGEYRIPDFMKVRVTDAHLGGFFPYPFMMIRDGMDEPERIPEFQTDPELMALAKEVAAEIELTNAHGDPATILTDTVGGSGLAFNDDAALRDFIREEWGSATCDRESAALAQVAWVHQVPILQVRAVSDLVGNESPGEFDEFRGIGELNAARFVDRLLDKLPQ